MLRITFRPANAIADPIYFSDEILNIADAEDNVDASHPALSEIHSEVVWIQGLCLSACQNFWTRRFISIWARVVDS